MICSCQKEFICDNCTVNKAPVAIAGRDIVVSLPRDSAMLDGSASTDMDGKIVSWKWTAVSGSPGTIASPDSARTLVRKLKAGEHLFQLSVTDNQGSISNDTVIVRVDSASALLPVANAGQDQMLALGASQTILDGSLSYSPDNSIASWQWKRISGSAAAVIDRPNLQVTGVSALEKGTTVFELTVTDSRGASAKDSVSIVITDESNACDTARPRIPITLTKIGELSKPRRRVKSGAVGNRIIFAGGWERRYDDERIVDIYDVPTNTWTTATLSSTSFGKSIAVAGNKVFLAGGQMGNGTCCNAIVDIYDAVTNTWSTSQLSVACYGISIGTTGSKVFFSGGMTEKGYSDVVDIYDVPSG